MPLEPSGSSNVASAPPGPVVRGAGDDAREVRLSRTLPSSSYAVVEARWAIVTPGVVGVVVETDRLRGRTLCGSEVVGPEAPRAEREIARRGSAVLTWLPAVS